MLILNQHIVFFCLENEYKLSGTKSKQIPKMYLFSGLLKKLKENQLKKYNERI